MAAAFNLTAQINLRGPANIKPIVSKIQKDINNAKIKLNLDVNQNAAKNITSITTRLNSLTKAANNANSSITNLNTSLSSLVTSLGSINSVSSANVNNLAKTTQAVSSAGKAVAQTRSQMEEFGKQSGLAIKRFAAFSTVTTVVYGLVNAFDSAFKEFFNFNQEIVRLSQVTGKSVADLGDISKEITRLSTSLGVASSDLLTVATTLAQAGLSAEDTKIALEALAKSALAPSFDSLTDTTEGAIAAIRQFGLQTKELDSALGSINAVAATFAVEASDIITAIQRTGGVFSSASRGVSEGTDALNEFIAIFTSVRATTRESAETIATGLRTIFTRIQRTKTIEQLREFGIELQDTEGKFIGLFEATRRLSEGLSKIDPRTTEFATISEELGGFRQIGKVIPLIQQFAVTEQALAVAQKGSASTAKDALVAQQSLAVQFSRTRENFLALVRELGESTSFKAFVGVSLVLADSFINLARSLKPLLPLLLTFASIKVGGAIKEFGTGFGGVFGGGGGGPIVPVSGGGTGGGRGGSGTLTALSTNTSSLNLLNQSILALNQNIVNTNSLLLNRPMGRFASGGLVPGQGNTDTYSAMLTPGEFVIRKKAVESIGANNLARMNRGGEIQKFVRAGTVKKAKPLEELAGQALLVEAATYGVKATEAEREAAKTNKRYRSAEENSIRSKLIKKIEAARENEFRALNTTQFKIEQDIASGNILEFAAAGLRYGGGFPKVITDITPDTKQTVKLYSGSLSNRQGKKLERQLFIDFKNSVKTIATSLASSINAKPNLGQLDQSIANAGFSNVIGAALESVIGAIGAPYVPKTEESKSIDFIQGLGPASSLFGLPKSSIPTDVTRTLGGNGKGVNDMIGQIDRYLKNYLKFPVKKANGGSIASEDTVPALLTPGEFVFNKKAAQRIGYNNLNKLNQADRVQGFNKGGVVGYANGGMVDMVGGGPGVIAAITAVILPQVEKLASSFGKLDGALGTFGTAIGGAIREASSLTLSAGIALNTVGASRGVVAAGQAGAAVSGLISGALTDTTGRLLEKALLKNADIFGKFDKTLQDISNAPTEELRLQAATDLQKTFAALDASVQNTKGQIDSLQLANNFGKAINDITLTILTSVTAITALSGASKQAAATLALSKTTTGVMAPLSMGTKLLGTFGKFIPIIGGLITAVEVGVQLFGVFGLSLIHI